MSSTAVVGTVRAMACAIDIHVPDDLQLPDERVPNGSVADVESALRVFGTVHRACTRFDPESALMQVNARPDRWHDVPAVLFDVLREAYLAHLRTSGRFDPRVIGDLERLGYVGSLPFEDGPVATDGTAGSRPARTRWRPRLRRGARCRVHLGGTPVDLGGIGKGMALRWAAERMAASAGSFLIDAGGDCVCRGNAPGLDGWNVGVEHPDGRPGPIAVLTLSDRSVATSSTRLRRWTAGGVAVHHLIDPRTGLPGGRGLAAVTVVAVDPAEAEVTSKALFLLGADAIGAVAHRDSVAALWVDDGGTVATSPAMDPFVTWREA